MTNNTIFGLGAMMLIIGLGIGYALSGGSYPEWRGGMPGGYSMSRNIDQHFIAQMIPHHEGAIEMARIALERSKRPEMYSLASAIIAAQQKEIDDMEEWYEEWFGTTPPKEGLGMMSPRGGNMHMGGMEGDIEALTSVSESDFDREFILQMIPHHEMALMMASMLRSGTEREEMKQLAEDIIASQSQEIETMRGWLTAWYGQ